MPVRLALPHSPMTVRTPPQVGAANREMRRSWKDLRGLLEQMVMAEEVPDKQTSREAGSWREERPKRVFAGRVRGQGLDRGGGQTVRKGSWSDRGRDVGGD